MLMQQLKRNIPFVRFQDCDHHNKIVTSFIARGSSWKEEEITLEIFQYISFLITGNGMKFWDILQLFSDFFYFNMSVEFALLTYNQQFFFCDTAVNT